MPNRTSVDSVAEAYLELLAARGVEWFFGNAGTDFAPLIEAFAKRQAAGQALPRPVTVPHETVAVAMAHGHAMVSGRPQAVMVHVTVGTANALAGLMNAARASVPMLFTAGRTPLTEGALPGARDRYIHWAQESFDQGALAREWVKWDYELRSGSSIETVVDRALAIARSEPAGPVYLTLPREVLAERLDGLEYAEPSRLQPTRAAVADPAAVDEAARVLAAAQHPVAIVKAAGRDPGTVAPLAALAETLGMPVVEHWATHLNFPQDHPLHAGFEPGPHLDEADAILVIESDVPWFPKIRAPRPGATIVQVGHDPLLGRYPIRGHAVDVGLGGSPRLTLAALAAGVARAGVDPAARGARLARLEEAHRRRQAAWQARADAVSGDRPIDMAWVSRCLRDVIDDRTLVVNEYDLDTTQTCFTRPGSYFGASPASGLGWGLGAALGAKLAAPEHTVICCVGDGAYLFGTPVAAHWVARAYALPVLTVVFNNRGWNAVTRAVRSHAPEGWAVRTGAIPMSSLDPAPDYALVCQAGGGWGERVEDPAALPEALRRALAVVREERRQALLDVVCKRP